MQMVWNCGVHGGMNDKKYVDMVWTSWGDEKWQGFEESVSKIESKQERKATWKMKGQSKDYMCKRGAIRGGGLQYQARWSIWIGISEDFAAKAIP